MGRRISKPKLWRFSAFFKPVRADAVKHLSNVPPVCSHIKPTQGKYFVGEKVSGKGKRFQVPFRSKRGGSVVQLPPQCLTWQQRFSDIHIPVNAQGKSPRRSQTAATSALRRSPNMGCLANPYDRLKMWYTRSTIPAKSDTCNKPSSHWRSNDVHNSGS